MASLARRLAMLAALWNSPGAAQPAMPHGLQQDFLGLWGALGDFQLVENILYCPLLALSVLKGI